MPNLIAIKIDVTKIDKSKMFKGAKGTYLDVMAIPSTKYENQDYMIVQSVSKEDRAQGIRGEILGSARIIEGRKQDGDRKPAPKKSFDGDDSEAIPF